MQKIWIDDIFYRNKRIREFAQKFREKDISCVLRDIALLGIELFESMNPCLLHYLAIDVENTLANFWIAKENKARLDMVLSCNTIPKADVHQFEFMNGQNHLTYESRN